MIWTIVGVILVLWLVGLVAHIGGALIHLLLIIVLIVAAYQLITGRRAV